MDKYTGELLANIHKGVRILKLGQENMERVNAAIEAWPDDRKFRSIQAELEGAIANAEASFDECVIELWAIAALN